MANFKLLHLLKLCLNYTRFRLRSRRLKQLLIYTLLNCSYKGSLRSQIFSHIHSRKKKSSMSGHLLILSHLYLFGCIRPELRARGSFSPHCGVGHPWLRHVGSGSPSRDHTWVPALGARSLGHETSREAPAQTPPDDRHLAGVGLTLPNLPHTVFLEWKDTKQRGRWRPEGTC